MNKKQSQKFVVFIATAILYGSQLSAQISGSDALQIIESTGNHITIQLKIDSILTSEKVINQQAYHLISIPGFNVTTEPGKPQLPTTGLLLAMPPIGSVNWQIIESQTTSRTGLTIIPATEQILDETSRGEPRFLIDENFYKQDIWYPQELVKIGETGFIRDQRLVMVQIYPVQFNPAQKMLRIYESLTVRLDFEGTAEQPAIETSNPEFENVLQKMLPNYEIGKNWRRSQPKSLALQKTNSAFATSDNYKIYVKEDGVYRLTKADLEAAGIKVSEIDPRTVKIFKRGQELPIYMRGQKDGKFDATDYIEFYGQFNRGESSYFSPYSISNVYWLVWGGTNGLRMAEVDGGIYVSDPNKFVAPASFQFSQHFEQDLVFDRLLLVTDESVDHWFWETMNANKSYQFKFSLPHPIASELSATVAAKFFGSTHPLAYPDHHVVIKINDHLVAEATWDGQTEKYVENREVANRIFKNGENVLTIEMPGDTPAGEIDQVFLNWFEVSYWRSFQAVDDFIEFLVEKQSGLSQFEISNFHNENITIIDNVGRRIVNFDKKRMADTSYTVLFQDESHEAPITYYVFSSKAIKKAEKIVLDVPSDLRSQQNGADYILITPEQFREAVQPLADHRSFRGLRVKIVDVQDIYDEFSDGLFDPRAIQKFLQYAYENWKPPAPLYVLLAGDATWANDKQVARNWNKPSYIPTVMKYTTSWGITSSDNSFVCVNGDDRLPDMFIGRLPVNTVKEAQIVIDKIINYETQPTFGDWRKRIALACGDGAFFEQSADYLYTEYIPKGLDALRLYTNPKSKYFGSTEELVAIFNNGVSLLNFIGHGGGGVFFDAELFLLEDIVLLNNASKLPVIFSLTCFIGYFDNPWTPSLGEELFRANGKGAIATFGSAGRAWVYGDYYLNNALFQSLFSYNHLNLGQVTTEAKWQMVAWSGGYWDHVENYNLLGDPALKIGIPEKQISLEISNPSLKAGELLTVKGTIPGNRSGKIKLTLFDSNDSLVAENSVSGVNNQFSCQIQLPSAMKTGQGMLKAYFWNEKEDAIGTATFGVEAPCFQQVFTDPTEPGHLDSIFILTKVEVAHAIAAAGIDSVCCRWSFNQNIWEKLPMTQQIDGFYRTQRPLSASEGTKVHFKIATFFRANNNSIPKSVESQVYSFTVKRRADLCVSKAGPKISGTDQIIIQTTIGNKGETNAENFSVEIYDGDLNDSGKRIGEKLTLNLLKAKTDTTLNFPWQGEPTGAHSLFIKIDAENQVDEFSENNNIFQKAIQLLTIKNGSGGEVSSNDKNFSVDIAHKAVTMNSSFSIIIKTKEQIDQSYPIPQSFALAALKDSSVRFYSLQLENEAAKIVKPFSISLFTSAEAAQRQLKIYAWDGDNDQWSYRTTHIDSSNYRISAEAKPRDFLFGLFNIEDDIPPKISVKIENQILAEGDYVSSQPRISALIEDETGIDLKSQPPMIRLNDQPIDQHNLMISLSPNSKNMVLINVSLNLCSGEHVFKMKAADLAGNWNEATLTLRVSSEFELQAIANHPNPFIDETILAYTLTDEAREVKIKIYTASGRLIRSFDFINEVGYIEHVWDGCDEMGDEVANGIYYLRFVASNGKKKIERVQKLAKLK